MLKHADVVKEQSCEALLAYPPLPSAWYTSRHESSERHEPPSCDEPSEQSSLREPTISVASYAASETALGTSGRRVQKPGRMR